MPRRHTALLLLVAILMLAQGSASIHADQPINPTRVYLPVVSCLTCRGQMTSPTPGPIPSATPVDDVAYEARMIELVNAARVAAGCPVATPNAALMSATGAWSDYMRRTGDYSHGTFEQFQQKYAAYPGGVLENIDGGTMTPEIAFDDWLHSPPHQHTMLFCYLPADPSYNPAMIYAIGVGYTDGYWTLAIGWY